MAKKLVVFDLDGTLLDTSVGLNECMNMALSRFNLPPISISQTKQYVGNGILNYVKRATNNASVNECLQAYNEIYNRSGFEKTTPYSGVNELIEALKANNVKVALLSNKPHEATLIAYEQFFKGFNFDAVLGKLSYFPHKPDPTSLLHILSELKVAKEDAVMVGDGEADVMTATNAGIDCFAVDWGFRSSKQLTEAGAKTVVSTAEELLNKILNA